MAGTGSGSAIQVDQREKRKVIARNFVEGLKELTPWRMLQGMAGMTQSVISRHQDERSKAEELCTQAQQKETELMSRLLDMAQT
eukprot:12936538-Prorocentrum_lima.AAC.1